LGKGGKPADPQAIMLRRAQARDTERRMSRNPGEWGISAEIVRLPTSTNVQADVVGRTRVVRARRSDAFELLIDGATPERRASDRYVRDWCERMGVARVTEPGATRVDEQIDGQGRVQRMIDAGRRIDAAHALVGRRSVRLLAVLGESVAGCEVRVWRVLVEQVTGETERHAQAAAVRLAVGDLREAYDVLDGVTPGLARTPVRLWYAPPGAAPGAGADAELGATG
jgi:hypothetical protein